MYHGDVLRNAETAANECCKMRGLDRYVVARHLYQANLRYSDHSQHIFLPNANTLIYHLLRRERAEYFGCGVGVGRSDDDDARSFRTMSWPGTRSRRRDRSK